MAGEMIDGTGLRVVENHDAPTTAEEQQQADYVTRLGERLCELFPSAASAQRALESLAKRPGEPRTYVVPQPGERPLYQGETDRKQSNPEGVNPKDLIGMGKAPMHLIPAGPMVDVAEAMRNGASKYGPYNWREIGVQGSIYVSATKRHIDAWFDSREENAEDSDVHHLAHAAACLLILMDSQQIGMLKDDRPSPGKAAQRIKETWKK